LVYTQILEAINKDSLTISDASKSEDLRNALAAATAYPPPEPIPMIPSSGSV
jgi:hypothetical protein